MRLRASLTALTLLPMAAFTVAAEHGECTVLDEAVTEDATDDVLACESIMYLDANCDQTAGTKVYNPFVHGSSIPLTEEAPETSFTAGGGCGTVDDPLFSGTRQDTQFSIDISGYFAGVNPDTMTVELHDISASTLRTDGETTFGVRVAIDGESPLGFEENVSVDGTPSQSPATVDVTMEAIPSSTGISDGLEFTIIGLHDVLPESFYAAGEGAGHQVQVTLDVPIDGAHALVWGASEIPASVSFNAGHQGTLLVAR